MTRYKIQSMRDLASEMKAVARGEKPAPADAAMVSFESAEALLRLLTPENRELLRIIRDEKPQSVAELSRRTKRAGPNLARTLDKLAAMGLVEMRGEQRRRIPVAIASKFRMEIDPYGPNDKLEPA
jgi:predicted transcriptional regulator